MANFLILAGRRSGVTFLVDSLNSHPEIECSKDVFSIRRRFKYFQVDVTIGRFCQFRSASWRRQVAYLFRRQRLINAFLREIFRSGDRPGDAVNARGIRLSYEQARKYPQVLKWIRKNDVRVIHLIRENALKAIVSDFTAKKRGVTHVTAPVERVTVSVPPGELRRRLVDREKRVQRFREGFAGRRYLEISYESFLEKPESETRRILDFLGIERFVPLTSRYVKQNPEKLSEILENYAEIARVFNGTDFARYLEPAL
jgi:LPS sulfotransferase NodH